MKKRQFIDAVGCAGWEATHDAQHEGIEALWRQLFPVQAEVERVVKALELIERIAIDGCGDHMASPGCCEDILKIAEKET